MSLPMILQMEISQANIADASVETKTKLTDDLFRLLQVREKNQDMAKDWLLFISTSNFKITAGEIYLAFKMALARQLFDVNGDDINVLPELSNNTTGKVIAAYQKHKSEHEGYRIGKDQLYLLNAKIMQPELNPEQVRENWLEVLYSEMIQTGYFSDAWLLMEELENHGKINVRNSVKQRLYRRQVKKHFKELSKEVKKQGSAKHMLEVIAELQKRVTDGKKLVTVQNRCRSIVVCNYLKKHLSDFETFKKAINHDQV